MPVLLEEEDSSDVFVEPHSKKNNKSGRTKGNAHSKDAVNVQSLGTLRQSNVPESFLASSTSISSFKPSQVIDSTRIGSNNRRESIMTDVDDGGTYVEYTSEIPEGREIAHVDSVSIIRNNNLYFTAQSQPHDTTKYSTSTKKNNARYAFHQMVDAVKKQRMLQQITQVEASDSDECISEEDPFLPSDAFSSTMVGGTKSSSVPFSVPDISSLTINSPSCFSPSTSPLPVAKSLNSDSIPLNSRCNRNQLSGQNELTSVMRTAAKSTAPLYPSLGKEINVLSGTPAEAVECIDVMPSTPLNDSLISEDISLADSETIKENNTVNNTKKKIQHKLSFSDTESSASDSASVVEKSVCQSERRTPDENLEEKEVKGKVEDCNTPTVKKSVYQWVANSPFKDGSFDTSFLKNASKKTSQKPLVFDLSSEGEDESLLPQKSNKRSPLEPIPSDSEEKSSDSSFHLQISKGLSQPSQNLLTQHKSVGKPHASKNQPKGKAFVSLDDSDSSSCEFPLLTPLRERVKAKNRPRVILLDSNDDDNSTLSPQIKAKLQQSRSPLKSTVVPGIQSSVDSKTKNCHKNKTQLSLQKDQESNKSPIKECILTSDSEEELSSYMKRWKEKKKSRECMDDDSDDFIHDNSCDNEDLSFYLPSLSLKSGRKKEKPFHREILAESDEDLQVISAQENPKPRRPGTNKPSKVNKGSENSPPKSVWSNIMLKGCPGLSDSDDVTSPITLSSKKKVQPKSTTSKGSATKRNLFNQRQTGLQLSSPTLEILNSFPKPRSTPSCNKIPGRHQLYTPQVSKQPRKFDQKSALYNSIKRSQPPLTFLASLADEAPLERLHPEAVRFVKNYGKHKDELVKTLFCLYNSKAFNNQLPADMKITWNVNLRKTAGLCYYLVDKSKPSGRGARIELSTKVLDSPARLRCTFIHELCHACSWIISGYKDGHGKLFKAW